MDEHIMTDAEFFQRAKQWADMVRRQAKAAAAGFPKGKQKATHTYKTGRCLIKSKNSRLSHLRLFSIPC